MCTCMLCVFVCVCVCVCFMHGMSSSITVQISNTAIKPDGNHDTDN